MSLTLKVDGRKKRGLAWTKLNTCGKAVNQGAIVSNKVCSNCNKSPDFDKQVIKCMKCNLSFHIDCLLMPITEADVKQISENPSMWWFCLSCVSTKTGETPVNAANENNNGPLDVMLQNTLSNFKKEMLVLVGETIEQKLKKSGGNTYVPAESITRNVHTENVISTSNIFSHTDFPAFNDPINEELNGVDVVKNVTDAEKCVLILDPKDTITNALTENPGFNKKTVSNVKKGTSRA